MYVKTEELDFALSSRYLEKSSNLYDEQWNGNGKG